MVIWPAVVTADTALNMQLQRFLNALGYDVGAVDGIVGKNTKAQLNNAFSENGYTFDGSVDDDEIKILKSIAQKKRITLPERMLGVTRKHLEQIMDKKTARLFVENKIISEEKTHLKLLTSKDGAQPKLRSACRMKVVRMIGEDLELQAMHNASKFKKNQCHMRW